MDLDVIDAHLNRADDPLVAAALLDDDWAGWDAPLGQPGDERGRSLAYSPLHVAAAMIAERCASTDWTLIDERTGEDATDALAAPAREVLTEPNDWTDWHDLVFLTVLDLREDPRGEAYWLLDDGTDDGRMPETALPARIFRWMPRDVRPVRSGRSLIGYGVRTRQGGTWEPWLAHEVVYFRRPSRANDLRGYGLAAGIAGDVRGARSREQLATEHAENGAPVRYFIEMPEGLAVEDWAAYTRKYRDLHSGIGNRFRTSFLLPGAKPHAANDPVFSDALVQVLGMDRRNVLADAGMPEALITGEMADYKLSEVTRNQERMHVVPQLDMLRRAINRQLLGRAGLLLQFNLGATYTAGEKMELATLRAKIGGVSFDELREMVDEPPLNTPEGRAIRDASGQVVADGAAPETVRRAAPDDAEAWNTEQQDTIDRLAGIASTRFADVIDRALARAEDAIGGTIVRRAENLDERVARALAAVNIPGLNADVGATAGKVHAAAAQQGHAAATRVTRRVKVKAPNWDLKDREVAGLLRRLQDRPSGIGGVSATVKAQITATLQEGVLAGESPAKLRARVRKVRKGYRAWQADRIARTEVAEAYVAGANLRYRRAGITEVVVLDGRGSDTDTPCVSRNGRRMPIDEWEAQGLLHPNCTAAASPVIPGA